MTTPANRRIPKPGITVPILPDTTPMLRSAALAGRPFPPVETRAAIAAPQSPTAGSNLGYFSSLPRAGNSIDCRRRCFACSQPGSRANAIQNAVASLKSLRDIPDFFSTLNAIDTGFCFGSPVRTFCQGGARRTPAPGVSVNPLHSRIGSDK
jgi:hypothetical protein